MTFKKRKPEPEQGRRISVFVATPAYDGRVLTDYAISLAESCQVATLSGVHVQASVMGNGAFIDLARNTFVQMFLDSDCTHLFFIDADLRWEARAFLGLVTSGLPVCAGVYPKRQDPEEYPCHWMNNADGTLKMKDGWIVCDKVPAGFLLLERKVVEEMAAKAKRVKVANNQIASDLPQLFYTYVNQDGGFVGEDFAWCEDYVKQYGDGIPVWPDFDFTHGVRWKGNFHEWLNKKAEEVIAADPTAVVEKVAA